MSRPLPTLGAIGAALLLFPFARTVDAQTAVPLRQLADASTAIVIGQVESMASGRDPATLDIYTFVTVANIEILKGDVRSSRIVVKQLGGQLDDEGIRVVGQSRFGVGEEVLLFLAIRPRDRSLYTTGLWQGKWTIELDAIRGERVAVRRADDSAPGEVQSLAALRAEIAGSSSSPAMADELNVASAETLRQSLPFELQDPPVRWTAPPVDVRVDSGGQPGLTGGGNAEIAGAIAQWNAPGSGLRLNFAGASQALPCASDANAIQIRFNDPCGEIGDPIPLALTKVRFFPTSPETVGGRVFYPIVYAVIITSANPDRRGMLLLPSCFQSIIAHELGHAIGFGHSPDPTALMYFQTGPCAQGPVPLAADDVAGLFAIYPRVGSGAPGSATVTSAISTAGQLTLAWTLGFGAAPTAHRLDFFSGAAQVASLTVGPATSAAIPIPPNTVGTFSVRITALNGTMAGPTSTGFAFTIGSGGAGGCTGPPSSPLVTGALSFGTASVNWSPVPGAASYIISAGTTPGAANLLSPTNLGVQTSAGASNLPDGFAAWVRVIAVNGCGQSPPVDLYLR